MADEQRPGNPFDEAAARAAIEGTQRELEESRRRRKQAEQAFDAFLRSFGPRETGPPSFERPPPGPRPEAAAPPATRPLAPPAPAPPAVAPMAPAPPAVVPAPPVPPPPRPQPSALPSTGNLPDTRATRGVPGEDDVDLLFREFPESERRPPKPAPVETPVPEPRPAASPSAAALPPVVVPGEVGGRVVAPEEPPRRTPAVEREAASGEVTPLEAAPGELTARELPTGDPLAIPASVPPRPARGLPRGVLPGIAVIAAAAVGVVLWQRQTPELPTEDTPAASAPAQQPAPPSEPAPGSAAPGEAPAAPGPAVPSAAPAASGPPPAAELTTTRDVWVRVLVDGQRTIERVLPANSRIPLAVRTQIVIRTGDAGALRVSIGGKDQGRLGGDGEVVTRTFTPPSASPR